MAYQLELLHILCCISKRDYAPLLLCAVTVNPK